MDSRLPVGAVRGASGSPGAAATPALFRPAVGFFLAGFMAAMPKLTDRSVINRPSQLVRTSCQADKHGDLKTWPRKVGQLLIGYFAGALCFFSACSASGVSTS